MKTQGGNNNNGALLSRLVIKYYVGKEINLATLVSFRLWPEYLKHFGKYISMYICKLMCSVLLSAFRHVT